MMESSINVISDIKYDDNNFQIRNLESSIVTTRNNYSI